MSLIGEIWKEAFEVFENAPLVFIERKEEIDQGVSNLTSAVDRLHGTDEQQSIGSHVMQFAQEPLITSTPSDETPQQPQVLEASAGAHDQLAEARDRIDAIFDDIYREHPDLQEFDGELTGV